MTSEVGRWPNMDGPTFGELLRRHRKLRHMTQDDLAERARTDKGTISKYEDPKNTQSPTHDMVQRIVAALDARPEPFLRALGYPVGVERPEWEVQLLEDDRLDETAKQALLRIIRPLLAEDEPKDRTG